MTVDIVYQVKRGGWGSGSGGYEVTCPDNSYATEQMGFSGIEDELDSFISLVIAAHSIVLLYISFLTTVTKGCRCERCSPCEG